MSEGQKMSGMLMNSGCPQPEIWDDIAIGVIVGDKAEQLLQHASQCADCARTLKESLAVFTPDSSAPSAQGGFGLRLAAAAAVVFALASLGLWYWKSRSAVVPELLAKAYTTQRSLDLRWPGAAYSTLRTERGPSTFSYEFHKSRQIIAQELANRPDDPDWLLRFGQSLIIEGDGGRAVTELSRALRLGSEATPTKLALAMAYYLRAGREDGGSDLKSADSFLSDVLAANPRDPTALFNRALVQERLGDQRGALALWDQLISLEGDEGWRNEASEQRSRLRENLKREGRDPRL